MSSKEVSAEDVDGWVVDVWAASVDILVYLYIIKEGGFVWWGEDEVEIKVMGGWREWRWLIRCKQIGYIIGDCDIATATQNVHKF